MNFWLLAVTVLSLNRGGVDLKLDAETTRVDPAHSLFLTLTMTTAKGVNVAPPDFRDRVRGFTLAEDFEEDPETLSDGSVKRVVQWRLDPAPAAESYRIAPFAIAGTVAGPVKFEPPDRREPVTGEVECDPKKALPPFSWKLTGEIAAALAAFGLLGWLAWLACKALARRVREHRMSPIERAWAELSRLLDRRLPGRGKYKDFYVELTMVVRRYVQRKYGINAPHRTTEEFLAEIAARGPDGGVPAAKELGRFLESADLVKFAGVEATVAMTDEAVASARDYLRTDNLAAAQEARK